MKFGVIIKYGDWEYPCITQDDGRCSLACPNYCTPDGYSAHDASILGLPLEKLSCAIGCEHFPKKDSWADES